MRNFLYLNDGHGNFSRDTTGEFAQHAGTSAGAAWADYDLDGDLDIFVANWGSSDQVNRLYRNNTSGFVTVTGVDVSPDLANARVSVSVMGTDAQKRTSLRGLRNSASFIQTAVFRRMRVKRAPRIEFALDETVERSFRMSQLIREARASDPDGGAIPTEPAPDPAEVAEAAERPERPSRRKRAPEGDAEEEPPIEEF